MKVSQFHVKNQFIITEEGKGALGNFTKRETFQSYKTVIATITYWPDGSQKVELDAEAWDYGRTTGKYRNKFLGEDKKATEKKIKNGTYVLCNLN